MVIHHRPGSARFSAAARLVSRRDFQRVFTDGIKLVGRSLILWCRPSSSPAGAGGQGPAVPAGQPSSSPGWGRSRLGLCVSAKLGGAVTRNRIKRLLREAFRLNRARMEDCDFIAYPRPGCRWKGLPEAQRDFLELCRKAGALGE